MRHFALVLLLTGCGSPFTAGASLAPDGSELAQADAGGDAAAQGTGGADSGTDAGQADSRAAEVSAGGMPGTDGGSGQADSAAADVSAGGAAAGGAGGDAAGGAGAGSGGAPGSGGSAGAATGGAGPCEAALCQAVLDDGSSCNSRCCTADGKCGCGGGMCAPVGECTRVLQSICGGLYAFKCPGVAPPSGCTPGTANTGYPYFCCPQAVYP